MGRAKQKWDGVIGETFQKRYMTLAQAKALAKARKNWAKIF